MTAIMHHDRPVADARTTSLGLYLTAAEAYDRWQADPDGTHLLDVRTPEEWVFTGHAPMAMNVPFAYMAYVWDDEKQGFPWELNADFVEIVSARLQADDTILVSCRSGGRSAMAVNMLAAAGFTNAWNVLDGMEGDKVDDPDSVFHGMRMRNGWKASGLPWTYGLDRSSMTLPERPTGPLERGNAAD